jgi:hypothetical protein
MSNFQSLNKLIAGIAVCGALLGSLAILMNQPATNRPATSASRQPPFAWVSVLGASDSDTALRGVWDPALATYAYASAHASPTHAYVFYPQPTVGADGIVKTKRFAATDYTQALRVPAAWWLLLCGLIGVIGVARRRRVTS